MGGVREGTEELTAARWLFAAAGCSHLITLSNEHLNALVYCHLILSSYRFCLLDPLHEKNISKLDQKDDGLFYIFKKNMENGKC